MNKQELFEIGDVVEIVTSTAKNGKDRMNISYDNDGCYSGNKYGVKYLSFVGQRFIIGRIGHTSKEGTCLYMKINDTDITDNSEILMAHAHEVIMYKKFKE